MMKIHQLVAGFRVGDAICEEALILRRLFREHGMRSDIYCEASAIHPDSVSDAHDMDELAASVGPNDWVILHFSIGSPVNLLFATLPCRRCLLYHNVTPPEYFMHLDPSLAQRLALGREQAAMLRGVAELNLAVSAYNASELQRMGYEGVKVFPLVVDFDVRRGNADAGMKQRLQRDGLLNLLFVGRVVPNKRHDRLITLFHYFQTHVEPHSRLIIAGSSLGAEAYKILLLGQTASLGLGRVMFTEFLSDTELNACYASADAFVCLSDHEGFCAPLLEAMIWDVPIFAKAAAAVPETLGGAGIVFGGDSLDVMAEAMGRVLRDPALTEAVIARQRIRLAQFSQRDVWEEARVLFGLGESR